VPLNEASVGNRDRRDVIAVFVVFDEKAPSVKLHEHEAIVDYLDQAALCQVADSNLAAVKSKLLQLESAETTLRNAQKDLFRSYPRNRDRQIRRSNFFVALHTGSLWKRKPRIR
jgi:hypothetical protein